MCVYIYIYVYRERDMYTFTDSGIPEAITQGACPSND